jgi:hypothetical protein
VPKDPQLHRCSSDRTPTSWRPDYKGSPYSSKTRPNRLFYNFFLIIFELNSAIGRGFLIVVAAVPHLRGSAKLALGDRIALAAIWTHASGCERRA